MISYSSIFIVPIIALSFICIQTMELRKQVSYDNNKIALEQTRDIIDARINEINNLAIQMTLEPRIRVLLKLGTIPEGSPNYYKIYEAINDLPKYKLLNSFIYEYYIFLKDSNLGIKSDSAICNLENFYDRNFKYNNLDYDSWSDLLWENQHISNFLPASDMVLEGKNHKVINYLQSLPYDVKAPIKGTISVIIEEQKMVELLDKVNTYNTGLVYIVDNKGRVITQVKGAECKLNVEDIVCNTGSNENILKQKLVINSIKSKVNDWTYVSVIPHKDLMRQIYYILYLNIGLILLTISFGLILAYHFSRKSIQPIKTLILKVKTLFTEDKIKGGDEYLYLDNIISKLIKNNESLKDKIDEHKVVIKTTYLKQLLYGEIRELKEYRKRLEEVDMSIEGENIGVFIMGVKDYKTILKADTIDELNLVKVIIKESLQQLIKQNYYFYDIDEKNTAVIMMYREKNITKCKHIAQKIIDQVQQYIEIQHGIKTFVTIGRIYNDILDISYSFNEAIDLLENRKYEKDSCYRWYKEITESTNTYYFPIEVEIRLINAMKLCDNEEVKRIIQVIYNENFDKRELSIKMKEELIVAMKGTVLRGINNAKYNSNLEQMMKKIEDAETIEDIFNNMISVFIETFTLVNEAKNIEEDVFRNNAIQYIEKSYGSCELSLYHVAQKLKVTEHYMYQFFKGNMGVSFTEFLEGIRIRNACELLSYTKISIKEISKQTGYTNDNSFRRAFKRVMSISPRQYRTATKESKVEKSEIYCTNGENGGCNPQNVCYANELN